jgi:NAD(P)-dependent dehydrogenase (short-subunit alcohol dehydrogenase family)
VSAPADGCDGATSALAPKPSLARLGHPEETARAAFFLAGDASSFM